MDTDNTKLTREEQGPTDPTWSAAMGRTGLQQPVRHHAKYKSTKYRVQSTQYTAEVKGQPPRNKPIETLHHRLTKHK